MAKKATIKEETSSTESTTFVFDTDKKHSWLFREDNEKPLLRSIYVSKEAFGGHRPARIALVMKALED